MPSRTRPAANQRPLWRCPRCGRWFVTRNLSHSCARVPLARHFIGKPRARVIFDAYRRAIEAIGPVLVVPNKTRIAFMVRVRFAGVTAVRADSLRCSLWITRRARSKRWVREDQYGPRCFVYAFELRSPSDLTAEIRRYLREAYAVGCQLHLAGRPARISRGAAAR